MQSNQSSHTLPFVKLSFFFISVLCALVFSVPGAATEISDNPFFPFSSPGDERGAAKEEWYALGERIARLQELAEGKGVDEARLRILMNELSDLKKSIAAYIEILESQQEKMAKDLETLGAVNDSEPEAVAEQRRQIQQSKGLLDGKLSGYRLLLLQSEELLKKLTAQRQKLLTQHFFAQGPSVVELLGDESARSLHWLVDSGHYVKNKSGLEMLQAKQAVIIAGLLVAALLLGGVFRRRSRRWCEGRGGDYPFSMMLHAALGSYAQHLLVASVLALSALVIFHQAPYPLVSVIALPLPLLFLIWALLQTVFQGKCGLKGQSDLAPGHIHGIGQSLKFFMVLAYIGYLIFATDVGRMMPEAARFLVRDIFVTAMIVGLLWGARHLHALLQQKGVRGFFGIVLLAMMGVLLAELSGYRNLSYWILRAMLGTLFTFGALMLLVRLIGEFFEGLQKGDFWWQRSIRLLLGYDSHEKMSWVRWGRSLGTLLLWAGFAYVVMLIWGVSAEAMQALYNTFFEGFLLGSLRIVPARIVIAIMVFAVVMAVGGWLKRRMDGRWLVTSRMERGSREALVTLTGYVSVAIAIIISLSVAGVQFTNLAIIAGALSVGIGFGLQNIVNNFISGLILLFERPVKTGDWIIVGNTEGYVKRISIRATLIQTFDRADVIVPNSELISSQVTNWMLYDTRGRIRVSVGVAYGSDTQKVKAILLHIAEEHPNIISDGTVIPPKVLFTSFGDSALNFELRAFIQNIDDRLQVISDINFAIEAAFREEGIQIPFPQRDLHIRDWAEKGDS